METFKTVLFLNHTVLFNLINLIQTAIIQYSSAFFINQTKHQEDSKKTEMHGWYENVQSAFAADLPIPIFYNGFHLSLWHINSHACSAYF